MPPDPYAYVGHVGHAFFPIPGKYRINYYNKGVNNSNFRESRKKDVTHLTQTAQMQWWCGVEGVMESVTQNVTHTKEKKVRLTETDRKHIRKNLINVKEMLSRQQVIDHEELALRDLLSLESHVERNFPGSRKIFHALSYVIHLKRIRAGLVDGMPSDAEGFDYVDYYLKHLPLKAKYEAFVSLLDKTISLCGNGTDGTGMA